MNNDQTQETVDNTESQPSDEVLALLGDHAVEATETEEVKTETTDQTEHEEDETKPTSEEDTEEESDESDETEDETEEEESQEFLVAGVKYDNIDDAVKAVNRISGDNTRLAGDVNLLNNQLSQKDEEIQTLQEKIKEWQEFYDNDGEGESPEKVNIDEKIRQALQEEKKREQMETLRNQYRSELDDLQNESDYSVVIPHMHQLAQDLGESVKNISPKKLYKMARSIARGDDDAKVLETAKDIAEQTKQKELNRGKAKKIIGGNAKKSPSIIKDTDISPEVAAVLM